MKLEQVIDNVVNEFNESFDFGDDPEVKQQISDGLRDILGKSLKDLTVAKKVTGGRRRKTGRRNGYNMFIAEKFKKLKEDDTGESDSNSQEHMTAFSTLWKTLSDEEKQPYNNLAKAHNENLSDSGELDAPKKSSKKGKRQLSGYNLYYKENRATLAAEAVNKGVRVMTHVGATWKALSDEEHKEYNERAKEVSAAQAQED